MLPDVVAQKLEALPAQPGCYLFRDKAGAVVYVGKAKSLRARVRSYFQDGTSDERYFIPVLRGLIGDLETILVGSEKEAAILENALIKEHQPRFNVKLRDDKEFLSLRLDPGATWARLEVVRKPAQDEARYYGPYPSATSARRTLHLVNKHFQLRTCSDAELASRKRPCLQHQIKRCPAPCVYEVDRAAYDTQVRAVGLFLEGRHDQLSRELGVKMREAAQAMSFELAAVYRDQIRAVASVQEGQRLVGDQDVDQDAVGLYREGDMAELAVMYLRGGRVNDTAFFSLKSVEIPDDELVSGFLRQHYDEGSNATLPDEILLPLLPEGADGVSEWLSERRGKKVAILRPQRGKKQHLIALAGENAAHAFREKRRANEDVTAKLADVQRRLRLPTLPRRIECVDISHLGGKDTVGAVVALTDGLPDKKRYRVFHVRGAAAGDDYGAMSEVLTRRFRRGKGASEGEAWELPDLLVVDGGRGQLNVALAAAHDLGMHALPIVGLAKERENVAGETLVDRVYLPGQKNGITLGPRSAPLFFLARARDEAHRFSNRARERLGKTARFASELDVRGVGPKTKSALLAALGTVAGIRAASDEALLAVPGVTPKVVEALRAAAVLGGNLVGALPPERNEVAAPGARTEGDLALFPLARRVLERSAPRSRFQPCLNGR